MTIIICCRVNNWSGVRLKSFLMICYLLLPHQIGIFHSFLTLSCSSFALFSPVWLLSCTVGQTVDLGTQNNKRYPSTSIHVLQRCSLWEKQETLGRKIARLGLEFYIHFVVLIDTESVFYEVRCLVQWFGAKCKLPCRMPYKTMRRFLSLLLLQQPQILYHLHFYGNDLNTEL